jgi:hypothetical protein
MNTEKALDRWVMMQDIPVSIEEKLAFMLGYTHASTDFLIVIQELKKELLRLKK